MQETRAGATPLFFAKSAPMVRLLVDKGADLHRKAGQSKFFNNISVLHHAASLCRSPQVLAALCDAGLDPSLLDADGASVTETVLRRLTAPSRFIPEPEREIRHSIGVLYWYGADVTQHVGEVQQKNPQRTARLLTFITNLSGKRKIARRRLVPLAASVLNDVTDLGELVAEYWIPSLSSEDIDAWDRDVDLNTFE